MHIHNVYFWLADGLDSESLAAFEQGLLSLTQDPQVNSGYYGKPADTHRDVVENSYSYGLVLVFDDLVSHDIYQAGSVHLSFVDANLAKWTKVVDNARFLFANSSAQANGGKPRIPAADNSFDL